MSINPSHQAAAPHGNAQRMAAAPQGQNAWDQHAPPDPAGLAAYVPEQASMACPPEYLRLTMGCVPLTQELLNASQVPFGAIIHPLAETSETPVRRKTDFLKLPSTKWILLKFTPHFNETEGEFNTQSIKMPLILTPHILTPHNHLFISHALQTASMPNIGCFYLFSMSFRFLSLRRTQVELFAAAAAGHTLIRS